MSTIQELEDEVRSLLKDSLPNLPKSTKDKYKLCLQILMAFKNVNGDMAVELAKTNLELEKRTKMIKEYERRAERDAGEPSQKRVRFSEDKGDNDSTFGQLRLGSE
jgi:hypothetical protein